MTNQVPPAPSTPSAPSVVAELAQYGRKYPSIKLALDHDRSGTLRVKPVDGIGIVQDAGSNDLVPGNGIRNVNIRSERGDSLKDVIAEHEEVNR